MLHKLKKRVYRAVGPILAAFLELLAHHRNMASLSLFFGINFFIFLNLDSLYARLNSHYEAWTYKKKKQKNSKAYR